MNINKYIYGIIEKLEENNGKNFFIKFEYRKYKGRKGIFNILNTFFNIKLKYNNYLDIFINETNIINRHNIDINELYKLLSISFNRINYYNDYYKIMNENIINIKIKDYISKLLKIKKINELFNIRLFDIPEFIKEKEYIYTLIYKFIYIKRILLKENNIINNSLIKELLDFEIYLLLKYPLLITTLYTNDSIYNKYINNTKYNLFIKKKILALLYMLKGNDDITTHNEHIFINNVGYKINNDLIEGIYDTDKIIHLEIENYINLELLDIYNKLYENNRIIEHYNKYKEGDIIVEINELSDKINNKLQILNNNSKILLNNVYIIELYSNSILYYIVYSQHL